MADTKHSGGNWFLADDLTIRVWEWNNCQQMGDYRGSIIADLKPALGASEGTPEGIALTKKVRDHAWPETEANGRLICAAPLLLSACRQLVEADRIGDKAGVSSAILLAQAAVKKAEGTP